MVSRNSIVFFCGLMLVYFLVRWALIFGDTGILRWYLTDLLFVPAMCTFGLIGVRLIRRDRTIKLSWWHVLIQFIAVSAYFEWYLPKHFSEYTADPLDVVMYFIGALVFLSIQKKL